MKILLSPASNDGGGIPGSQQPAADAASQTADQNDVFGQTDQGQQPPAGAQSDQQGAQGGQAAGTPPTPTGLSKEDITTILKEAGLVGQPRQAQQAAAQPEPQLTEEQFNQMFNVWQPSEALIAQLRAEDPKVAIQAILALRDGLVKQVMTMAGHHVKTQLKSVQDEHIAPLSNYVSERRASEFRDDFFKKYPDLSEYEVIVDSVAQKLQAQGFTADTREKVMERFAEESKKVVDTLLAKQNGSGNGQGNGQPQGQGQQKSGQRGQTKMSTLLGGGQTGGGTRGTADAKGPPGVEVFD